ncbi:hypothetical protein DB32_000716 [Sandaracinus amylolyticus]|uniref:Lipoprotein n=1 Tax=Sandaracinus amylolyticus TaxID=927083 RepID=A0A0F6VZH9_9BACT|nr:hypothetical protein DB32_000716 [Sandaracinus amylolyticus]
MLALGACGDDDGPSDAATRFDACACDAGSPEDAGTHDAATSDAATSDAATSDAATSDAAASDAATADTTDVTLTYGDHTETLDRAWMGYVRSGDEIVGLYFEINRGADDACPSATSPVPQQILTIDGFGLGTPGTQTYADGVRVQFFDFEGAFFEEIAPKTATDATVVVSALDVEAGTVEGTVELAFDDGTARGAFVATHCESLDGTADAARR